MGEYEGSESGNWNVNNDFVRLLAEHFRYIEYYKELSRYGSTDVDEDFQINNEIKTQRRLKALDRLIFKVRSLITSTWFAINDKEQFEKYIVSLDFYRTDVLPTVSKKINNRDKIIITVDENMFEWLYSKIDSIDKNLKLPLNRNDILFNFKEKFDPKEYKDKIKEGFIEGE